MCVCVSIEQSNSGRIESGRVMKGVRGKEASRSEAEVEQGREGSARSYEQWTQRVKEGRGSEEGRGFPLTRHRVPSDLVRTCRKKAMKGKSGERAAKCCGTQVEAAGDRLLRACARA